MRYYSLIFILVVVLSCSAAKNPSSSSVSQYTSDSLLAAVQRGACFGRCPEYKATIYKSGYAEYYGKKNVSRIGYYSGKLSVKEMETIITEIRNKKIEDLDTIYVNDRLADYPAWLMWISDLKPVKHIQISHQSPPAELMQFRTTFDAVIENVSWVRQLDKDQ